MGTDTQNTEIKKTAQDGEAVLLSTHSKPIKEILDGVATEWNDLSGDLNEQARLIVSEFTALGRSLLRCGFLIHQIEELKLYETFGFESTTAFMEAEFGMKAPMVSRFRSGYTYALPISQALPAVKIDDLNEAQMRELRGVVGRLHPKLKGHEKVEKAAELYKELYEKKPAPTANDIANLCPKPEPTSKSPSGGSSESTQKALSGESTSTDEPEEEVIADEDWNSIVDKSGKETVDDQLGYKLAAELSELLAYVLDHAQIDEDIQNRFERAFEELGIELPDSEDDEGAFDE